MSARTARVYRFDLRRSALATLALGGLTAAAAAFAGGVVLGLELGLAGRAEPPAGAVERPAPPPSARPVAEPPPQPSPEPPAESATTAATGIRAARTASEPVRPPAVRAATAPRLLPARVDPAALRPAGTRPPGLRFGTGQQVPEVPYGRAIYRIAQRHTVNPDVVAALIWAESAFDPLARSSQGARGLMQVMPATGDRFGVEPERLWEPEANLVAGVRYLSWLGERFEDDLTLVLAAYNAGEAAVDRHRGVPPFRETRDYVGKILGSLGLEEKATR